MGDCHRLLKSKHTPNSLLHTLHPPNIVPARLGQQQRDSASLYPGLLQGAVSSHLSRGYELIALL